MSELDRFFAERLPRALAATADRRGAGALYEVEVEGQGTWTVDLRGRARVAPGAAGEGACRIRVSADAAARALEEPRALWELFLRGGVQVSEGCPAVQLAEAVWPGWTDDSLPAPLARALFHSTPAPQPWECEMNGGPPLEHTYARTASGMVRLHFADVGGLAMFQGDIVLGSTQAMREVAAAVDAKTPLPDLLAVRIIDLTHPARYVWPGKTMPYKIDPALPYPGRVRDATAQITRDVGVTFKERTTETDYVTFFAGDGCWSYVGRRGGMQQISIAAGCPTGTVVHEIFHALGMWHEQSRLDRDTHVSILTQNILPNHEHNFSKVTSGSGQDLGTYDHYSLLHYGAYYFAKTDAKGKYVGPTILCKDEKYQHVIGQRDSLSAGDIAGMKKIYP